jgi:Putative peptidase family
MSFPPLARAMLVLAAAPWCASAQDRLTVVVFNYSAAPLCVVRAASATARGVFRAAGIQSRWIVCEEICGQALPPGPILEAFLMPDIKTPLSGDTFRPTAGYAMPTGYPRPRAYAFWNPAKDVSDRTLRPVDVVLGCILAHEAGHLLGLHHQPHGVMRASLDGMDMDQTMMGRGFNSEEALKLRAIVKQLGSLGL